MTDDKNRADDEIVQYEGGIPILKGRINDLENQARDAKYRDEKYKDAQLKLNGRLVWFTGVLALVGIIGGALGGIQAHLANETLRQIKNGKADTTRIITASETQATAANKIAGAADSFSETAGNAVEEFKKAATRSAVISQRAAHTAEEAMHTSERAYVAVASPQFNLDKQVIQAALINTGRMPSGPADTIIHYVIVNIPISTDTRFDMVAQAVEKHWRHLRYLSVPVGSPFVLNQAFKTMDAGLVNKGHQIIIAVGFTSYKDGFPDTPMQRSSFCYEEIYSPALKELVAVPCDPNIYLPAAEATDGYPENEGN